MEFLHFEIRIYGMKLTKVIWKFSTLKLLLNYNSAICILRAGTYMYVDNLIKIEGLKC